MFLKYSFKLTVSIKKRYHQEYSEIYNNDVNIEHSVISLFHRNLSAFPIVDEIINKNYIQSNDDYNFDSMTVKLINNNKNNFTSVNNVDTTYNVITDNDVNKIFADVMYQHLDNFIHKDIDGLHLGYPLFKQLNCIQDEYDIFMKYQLKNMFEFSIDNNEIFYSSYENFITNFDYEKGFKNIRITKYDNTIKHSIGYENNFIGKFVTSVNMDIKTSYTSLFIRLLEKLLQTNQYLYVTNVDIAKIISTKLYNKII